MASFKNSSPTNQPKFSRIPHMCCHRGRFTADAMPPPPDDVPRLENNWPINCKSHRRAAGKCVTNPSIGDSRTQFYRFLNTNWPGHLCAHQDCPSPSRRRLFSSPTGTYCPDLDLDICPPEESANGSSLGMGVARFSAQINGKNCIFSKEGVIIV